MILNHFTPCLYINYKYIFNIMNKYKYKIENKFYPCVGNNKWEINPVTGEVRDKDTHIIIEPTKYENDYVRFGQRYTLHRLLAETFIIKNYPEGTKLHVHHIDGDKHNNNLDNLMWLTPKEHFNLPEWKELQKNIQKGRQAGKNNPMYGYQWSEEQNKKRSELMYEVYKDPVHKQNLMNGLSKRGDEWKNNISLSKKGKYLVNNGKNAKFIDPKDLQKYLDNGWKRGRKPKIN